MMKTCYLLRVNTLAVSYHSESTWKSLRYAAQLFDRLDGASRKSMQNHRKGKQKICFWHIWSSVFLYWPGISSTRSSLSPVHCKHNEQTVSRSAQNLKKLFLGLRGGAPSGSQSCLCVHIPQLSTCTAYHTNLRVILRSWAESKNSMRIFQFRYTAHYMNHYHLINTICLRK